MTMTNAQIARLTDARRRNLTIAERALAAGDIASAEQARERAARLQTKIRTERTLLAQAKVSERQAQADAIATSESLTVITN